MITRIAGGTLVTSKSMQVTDVWIKDDKVMHVGAGDFHAEETIDASGLYLLPGGVDPHVHMQLPTPAGPSSDTFYTGSVAALHGGTTTIIDFVTPQPGQSLVDALEARMQEAESSLIDYSFHISPIEWRDTTAEEIEACFKRGITSFKIYMAYKQAVGLEDNEVERVLQTVGRLGGMITVHAEMGDEIDALRDQSAAAGKLEPDAHRATRPNHTEADAVKKVIDMAADASCPLYVVHVSTHESMEHIRNAQAKGQQVIAETCPHYLLLDESKYAGTFEETVKYVLSPPLRTEADQKALWHALKDGDISTIGTDHCPFTLAQKSAGKDDFRKIPNGAGGVEHRIALLYTYGVLPEKISFQKMVDVASAQPAKIFGLYPKKGEIKAGSDADLLVWDPNTESVISSKNHHQNSDLNIYEKFTSVGNAKWVIRSGEVVIADGELIDSGVTGKFLKRKNILI
ncbi:D-hydantoinase [Salinivirga cyanobacteriivorans]|uniref:D-hydantoinase n=1 Tax=Salinivirga cyanobacteriivorans TaxID=1307839 RepID=A0A0S2I224_9BACT|nr:dihydropyrimidinase [Salinivirga cyanobacteriivorans]ALO16350.1 D-hydantoinase [Salinivirga cyanobacteriivorans]